MLLTRLIDRSHHQAEILRLVIGDHVEMILVVVQEVFVFSLARQEDIEFAGRIVCFNIAVLRTQGVCRHDHYISPGLGLVHAAGEGIISLFEDQFVITWICAQNVSL